MRRYSVQRDGLVLSHLPCTKPPSLAQVGAPGERLGPADCRQHRQAAGPAAPATADKQGVTRMQPHIHESVPCRLVFQLRTYRCIAVNRRFGPAADSCAAANRCLKMLLKLTGEALVNRWDVVVVGAGAAGIMCAAQVGKPPPKRRQISEGAYFSVTK